MANVVSATMTTAGRTALAQSFGGPLGGPYAPSVVSGSALYSYGQHFKIGTSGFQVVSSQQWPVTPDPALTDLQSVSGGTFYYRSTFTSSDLLFISSFTMQFKCFLDLAFANGNSGIEPDVSGTTDGPRNSAWLSGGAPLFFEIGLFDNNHVMIAYGTFPGETKLNSKTLNHLVSVNF